jgi:hypothetical protein
MYTCQLGQAPFWPSASAARLLADRPRRPDSPSPPRLRRSGSAPSRGAAPPPSSAPSTALRRSRHEWRLAGVGAATFGATGSCAGSGASAGLATAAAEAPLDGRLKPRSRVASCKAAVAPASFSRCGRGAGWKIGRAGVLSVMLVPFPLKPLGSGSPEPRGVRPAPRRFPGRPLDRRWARWGCRR